MNVIGSDSNRRGRDRNVVVGKRLGTPLLAALLIGAGSLLFLSCGRSYSDAGVAAFDSGAYGKAVEYLEIALKTRPDDRPLNYRYAISLAKVGRTEEALGIFERLMKDEEYRNLAIRRMVETLVAAERAEEARGRLTKALLPTPRDPILLRALGGLEQSLFEDAREAVSEELIAKLGPQARNQTRWLIDRLVAIAPAQFTSFQQRAHARLAELGLGPSDRVDELVAEARKRLDIVRSTYESLCEVDPSAYKARLFLGKAALDGADEKVAEQRFREVAALEPEQVSDPEDRRHVTENRYLAVSLFREALVREKRYEDALKFLESMAEVLPDRRRLYHDLADLYWRLGRIDRLGEVADGMIASDPRSPMGAFYKGYVLFKRGKVVDSLTFLERARNAQTMNGTFNLWLGWALFESGSVARSLPFLEAAMGTWQRTPEGVVVYARALEAAGDPHKAQRLLGDALREWYRWPKSPEHQTCLKALQDLCRRTGEEYNSLSSARKALQADPTNTFILLRVAELEREENNVSEAAELSRRAIRISPNLPEARLVAARVAISAKSWRGALAHLDALDKLDPQRADSAWMRAEALLQLRDTKGAESAAKIALSRNPGSIQALGVLLRIMAARSDWKQVIETADDLLKVSKDNRIALEAVADAHEKTGNPEKSLEALERLAGLSPEDVNLQVRYALALRRGGRSEDGVKVLETAAALTKLENVELVSIAQALLVLGEADASLALLEERSEALSRGAVRTRALAIRMNALNRKSDYLGVLGAYQELRRSGEILIASRSLGELLRGVGGLHELLAVLEVARSRDVALDEGCLRLELDAALACGAWDRANQSILDLERLKVVTSKDLLVERARIALALQPSEESARLVQQVAAQSPPDARAALMTSLVDYLRSTGRLELATGFAETARVEAPNSASIHRAAGEALLARDQAGDAVPILERAFELAPADHRIAQLLVAALVADDQNLEASRLRLADERLRSLILALPGIEGQGKDPLGRFLALLGAGKTPQARAELKQVEDLPSTLISQLDSIAASLGPNSALAAPVAGAIARAFIFFHCEVLPLRAENALEEGARLAQGIAHGLGLVRAWVMLQMGEAGRASRIVVPQLERFGKEPLVVYLCSLVTLELVGVNNLRLVIDGHLGSGALPPDFARDLASAVERRGNLELAAGYLGRIQSPSPEDIIRRAKLLHLSGDYERASELILRIPERHLSHPVLRVLRAHALCLDAKRRREGIALATQLLEGETAQEVDAITNLACASAAGLGEIATREINRLMREHPYDPFWIAKALSACRGPIGSHILLGSLRDAVSVVDPTGRLRRTRRDERPRARW